MKEKKNLFHIQQAKFYLNNDFGSRGWRLNSDPSARIIFRPCQKKIQENRRDTKRTNRKETNGRRGKGGRVGMKTVHPRGQKRKEQEANVEVLSSQLSSALETKKRKTGGIRLDYFD